MFLQDEARDVFNEPFSFQEFQIVHKRNIPQQNNATDCGLYSLKFMEALAEGFSTCEKVTI